MSSLAGILPPLAEVAERVSTELLDWPQARAAGVDVYIRRDDLLPAWGQGNKFYKLYYNLHAMPDGAVCVSFGGPFSNHLHALALAAQALAIPVVGIVRGFVGGHLTPTLEDARAAGMQLVFVSRKDYAHFSSLKLTGVLTDWCKAVTGLNRPLHIIPEGGANIAGVKGARVLGRQLLATVAAHKSSPMEEIWLAVGTGTTLAGVIDGVCQSRWQGQVVGVPVIGEDPEQGYSQLSRFIGSMCSSGQGWRLEPGYSLGGYARTTPDYLAFLQAFHRETGVQLDHVYTGKLFWALSAKLSTGAYQSGARLLVVHSGGLQGLRGLPAEA